MEARKRRKWDVAAPGGMPLTGNRAGIGSGGGSKSGLSGFITAQGLQASAPVSPAANIPAAAVAAAAAPPPQVKTELKPGQPIDQATIARAQQGAQAIVERINAVRCTSAMLRTLPPQKALCQYTGVASQRSNATWEKPCKVPR